MNPGTERSGVAGDPVQPCPDDGDLEVVCDIEEEDGDIEMECASEEDDDPDLEFACGVGDAEPAGREREPRDKDGTEEEASDTEEEEEDDPDLDFACVLDEEDEADLELVCEAVHDDEPELDLDSAVEESTTEPARDSINSNA